MNSIRTYVSSNRKRYIDKDVNLDLSYITPRIIAMSYPSEGFESVYRNPFSNVKKFLDERHAGHYKIYNLRIEKQYDLLRFENASFFPFADHQAPPFSTLVEFCLDASEWLNRDSANVIAVHCKAGKGRTGTVICALLLYMGQATSAKEAMEMYGRERTDDMNGVTIPSQRRYIEYYDFMLKHPDMYDDEKKKERGVVLEEIIVNSISTAEELTIKVCSHEGRVLYQVSSKHEIDRLIVRFTDIKPIMGDFKVAFINGQGKVVFAFWLSSIFMALQQKDNNDTTLLLTRKEIDLAFSSKSFDENFSIKINFSSNSNSERY